MYIDDKLNDIILMMTSFEQTGNTSDPEYLELVRQKEILQDVINYR